MGTACGLAYWSEVARCATWACARRSRAAAERLGTETGEDLPRVQAHRPLLVLAGEVEHQVRETPLHVAADLLDVLVGVVRDDEAGVRLVGCGLSKALHLAGILDARLVLGR